MPFTQGDPHRERHPFCEVSYWKGHSASERSCADRASVEPLGSLYMGIDFPWPADEHRVASLVRFLGEAYELGRIAKAREVRRALLLESP